MAAGQGVEGWRGWLIELLGGYDASSIWDCFWYGAVFFLPIYIVTFLVGYHLGNSVRHQARARGERGLLCHLHPVRADLSPGYPLWQVALGISFGVVIGKEVFGGTGKNFLNPALTGRAFLYFAYPAQMSGDAVWTAVDGYTGATALAVVASDGMAALQQQWSWMEAFLGSVPGSIGETSTLAIFIGGVLLLTRVASWRIIAGVMLGMVALSTCLIWSARTATRPSACPGTGIWLPAVSPSA